jgi:hypothetical protein
VSSDGKDDLVWLTRTGPGSGRIGVALSDGTSYGPGQPWFEGHLGIPLNGARLIVGDFHADGRPDVAVLARGDTEGHAQLVVLRKKAGDAFGPPTRWWSGPSSMKDVAGAWAGDVSGDGRADLIVRQETGRRGVTIRTAVTRSPLPRGTDRMSPLRVGWSASLDPTRVRTVTGDANRDGRDDVLMLVDRGRSAAVERLQGQLYGGFKHVPVWVAPRSAGIVVQRTRLGAADLDFDGMTDLVLFGPHERGTSIRVLKTRYATMKAGPREVEPFEWRSVRPY